MSNNSIIPSKKDCLAVLEEKLTSYRTQHLIDGSILMEFWRVKQDKNSTIKNTPKTRDAAKEMAMICVDRSRKMFKVHYYPLNGDNQIIEELNIDKLLEVVQNLKDAGF